MVRSASAAASSTFHRASIGSERSRTSRSNSGRAPGRRVYERISMTRPNPSRYMSTSTLNPPYIIRRKSNGIAFRSIWSLGSFMTFLFTRSRCAFERYTM
jgi:hypothetical protein